METVKVFADGGSQAVRLPEKFGFGTGEAVVQRLGGAVLLAPKDSLWQTFTEGLNSFTDDAFEGGRSEGAQDERGAL